LRAFIARGVRLFVGRLRLDIMDVPGRGMRAAKEHGR
jgi:hypothetical protein